MCKKCLLIIVLIWFFFLFCGQSKEDKSAKGSDSASLKDAAVYISKESYKYPFANTDIRSIDFGNFVYEIQGEKYQLTNGRYEKNYRGGFDMLELSSVTYCNIAGNDIAIVGLRHHYGGGSSNLDSYLQFFRIQNNAIYLYYKIRHNNPSYITLDTLKKEIIIDSYKWLENDPHCCPSKIDKCFISIKNGYPELVKVIRKNVR